MERQRRGMGEQILLSGEAMKRPGDWGAFLSKDDNKTQLSRMVLQVWSEDRMAERLKDRHVIAV